MYMFHQALASLSSCLIAADSCENGWESTSTYLAHLPTARVILAEQYEGTLNEKAKIAIPDTDKAAFTLDPILVYGTAVSALWPFLLIL